MLLTVCVNSHRESRSQTVVPSECLAPHVHIASSGDESNSQPKPRTTEVQKSKAQMCQTCKWKKKKNNQNEKCRGRSRHICPCYQIKSPPLVASCLYANVQALLKTVHFKSDSTYPQQLQSTLIWGSVVQCCGCFRKQKSINSPFSPCTAVFGWKGVF